MELIDRMAQALLAVSNHLQERCDALDFMSDEMAAALSNARTILAEYEAQKAAAQEDK